MFEEPKRNLDSSKKLLIFRNFALPLSNRIERFWSFYPQ
jgi:hypothetical protein